MPSTRFLCEHVRILLLHLEALHEIVSIPEKDLLSPSVMFLDVFNSDSLFKKVESQACVCVCVWCAEVHVVEV